MKILGLLLRNFGKFQNQKLRFESGINIIYGENESGKSTIHTFIKGMLFGIGRGRGRASVYDTYSIYEPWENPGYYSGILRFESGGKTFRIDRNFDKQNKKAELVCEDDGENLSIENGDLELLLGGMDLSGYDNTISVGQLNTRPDQSLAAALKEYATSCCASGNGDLRPEQAIQRLEEQKKTIDKEIREALYERQRQRETVEQGRHLSGERSTASRKKKNRFVSGSGRQSGPGGNRASISVWWTRSVRQNGGSIRWRSSFFLLPLWRQFFCFKGRLIISW